MRFEFATATRIVFGTGTLVEAAPAARALGKRALVVVGKSAGRAGVLLGQLEAQGLAVSLYQAGGEPTIEVVVAGTELALAAGCELVIGMGGGSPLDAGKAIAAMLGNPGEIYDYLELVGQGRPLEKASLPFIAIPTTAGTGSEVTRNAVLVATRERAKVSLRSPLMLPRLAIVDPELTYGLPQEATAGSGMDAVTQLVEPFVSNAANPVSDAFCRDGLARAARWLPVAYAQDDPQAREEMALASLLGGMALANARLGAVHAFAGPLGGLFGAPHGALCARLLPAVMEANLRALQTRAAGSPILERFTEAARILTGDPAAQAEDGPRWLKELGASLKIAPLSAYGLKPADFPAVAAQAQKANAMKGNPVELTVTELTEILAAAF